ncbi:MAG: hypothetical protein DELT_00047 [Desulfovibrio sp.]
MKLCTRALVAALLMVMASAFVASAAVQTFTVAPFQVNGSNSVAYLEKSIPQMFSSRLFWKDQFEPAAKAGTAKAIAPADEAAAEKARAAAGADYIIWGSVTVLGEHCSIDVRVMDKSGKSWPISRESTVNGLIPDLRKVCDSINAEIFQIPQAKSSAQQQQPTTVNQMNPGLVRNEESANQQVYINPQFRYSGTNADESRLRSQTLGFAASGMEICDAIGNGKPQMFILEERRLHAFEISSDYQLKPLATVELPAAHTALSVRSTHLDGSHRASIIVNTKDEREDLFVRVFSFDGTRFAEQAKGLSLYLNVVNFPPTFKPKLVGQRANPPRLFVPGVREATIRNGKVELGNKINLPPKDFNVFNFAYIPAGMDRSDALKMAVLDEDEHLRLYSEKGARMYTSEEKYSGSVQGIYVDAGMPGMGVEHVTQGNSYYIPMRMLAVDLDSDGNYELIVNKPITTAGVIFSGYRSFPQSEIHSLQWDGLGLSLVWKTRRIKGSVVDYAITDANRDGILDLVLCVNTHPGALGAASRKAMIVAYPLDLSKADPNTRPSLAE